MGHNRNLADYAHHFDGTNIDLGSGNIETEGVVTYEDVTNVDSVGIITARAGVKVPDNQKVFLGTGDDLQIYHESSTGDSFIKETGSGNLKLVTSTFRLRNAADTEHIIWANQDAEVRLYHDSVKKFETTTTGATVTGTLVSDGVTSELDLSAISSSISNTAVDVFVYDTRKDSDGGAWRKRTQHTSWYNETLNTSTRGSRKEFPAVAVIVATTASVFIYDGDDPDLPLWMRFNQSTNGLGAMVGYTSFTIGCVTMLNGLLMVGLDATNQGNVDGLRLINFISEHFSWKADSASRNSSQHWPIEDRNGGRTLGYNDENYIVSEVINDVAATVLPNSKIDDATGLPIPTIAVGTNGGASIIKDNGTVVDITITTGTNYDVEHIDFTDDNRVVILWNAGGGEITIDEIPSADTSANYPINLPGSYYNDHSPASYSPCFLTEGPSVSNRIPAAIQNFRAVGTTAALSVFEENKESEEDGMVAFISSSYNTGYQQGRIKGAFLSDTDTTNAVAAYYDDFANNDNGWGFVNTSISGGNMVITQQSQARSTDGDALSHVSTGVKLVFTFTVSGSGTGDVVIDDDGAGAGVGGVTNYGSFSSTGSYTFTATKTASPRLRFIRNSGSNDYNINFLNISTEYDRSLNNKGLGVYGTVTKTVVATGAELVGYGPFSSSNYLLQPYNADLAPGTSEYSVICWVKTGTSTADQYIFDRTGDNSPRNLILIRASTQANPNRIQFYHNNASNTSSDLIATDLTVTDNVWHQVVGLYDGSTYKVYVDGVASAVTNSTVRNVDNTDSPRLYVGIRNSLTAPMTGQLALFRYSKTAPSPEQIKKMYEDEKFLFQENAKCTLYGSSDAVTALGYDEDTELLHVGTSSGRSDFQGLRRINNTTTAVTTAISASDELIAEQ